MRRAVRGWPHWLLTVIGVAVVVLVVLNNALLHGNRDMQSELAQRQQAINRGAVLGRLGDQLIRALATHAAQTNDAQIRDLLTAQGITFSVQQTPQEQRVASPPAGRPPAAAGASGVQ